MEHDGTQSTAGTTKSWVRIPDGIQVKHRLESYEGTVDGLTALVEKGVVLNPDHKTQYRVNVGGTRRNLAPEEDLLIKVDRDGLVLMQRASVEYRRQLTEQLRGVFAEDRFFTR